MSYINLTWNKEYAFIDPVTNTLAKTTDGRLTKMTLNIFQRCLRSFLGWYANTHLKEVGPETRKALFDPNWQSSDLQAVKNIAAKRFQPVNGFDWADHMMSLGLENVQYEGKKYQVTYEARFLANTSSENVLSRPHIQLKFQGYDRNGTTVNEQTSFHLHFLRQPDNTSKIEIKIYPSPFASEQMHTVMNHTLTTFSNNLLTSSKMNSLGLNLKRKTYENGPFSNDYINCLTLSKNGTNYEYLNSDRESLTLNNSIQLTTPISVDFLLPDPATTS